MWHVPYDGHAALLSSLATELAGKIVVDCVNPLGFDKQGPFRCVSLPARPPGGAADAPRVHGDCRVPPRQRGIAR
jgi:predicted dinucleotide-binding enzyme